MTNTDVQAIYDQLLEIAQAQGRQAADISNLVTSVNELKSKVVGNGKPGLANEVRDIQEQLTDLTDSTMPKASCAVLDGSVAKELRVLTDYQKKYPPLLWFVVNKPKETLGATAVLFVLAPVVREVLVKIDVVNWALKAFGLPGTQ